MILAFVFSISMAKADLSSIIGAHSVKELLDISSQEKSILQTHQRCQVELNDGFIPVACYKWIHQLNPTFKQRQLMLSWFDQSCKEAISQNIRSPEYALEELAVLSSSCRQALKSWSEEWFYKMSREDKEKFMRIFTKKFGREFVIPDDHGTRPVANSNKLSTVKPHRRRLN